MRDKEFQSYSDPAYSDFAWSKMEEMLDREMPVEQKKRRLVIWFWMAAGLALLVAGSIYLYGYGPNISFQNSSKSPVADLVIKKTENPANTTDSKIVVQKIDSEKNITKNTKLNSPNSPLISDVPVITTTIYPKQNEVTPNPDEATKNTSFPIDVFSEKTKIAEGATPKVIAVPLNPVFKPANEITTLALNQVDEKMKTFSFSEGEVSFSKKSIPKSIRFKGYITGQSADFSALQGYEAGLTVTKGLPKSRWSISMGSGFQSEVRTLEVHSAGYFQSDDAFPIGSSPTEHEIEFAGQVFVDINGIDSEILDNPSNGFGNLYSSNSNNSVNLNVQLNYLAFPLKVNYHLSPRLSLSAGITPSVYLSGAITDKKNYLPANRKLDYSPLLSQMENDASTSIPIANNRYFYFTSSPVAPAKIKRWKFPVSLGVDYQLTKHFGLTLGYQANLSSIIDKDFIKTDRQRMHFGGYWNF